MPASRVNFSDISKRRVTRAMAREFNIHLPDVGPFSPAVVRPLPDQRTRNTRSNSRSQVVRRQDLNRRIKNVYKPFSVGLPLPQYNGQPVLLRQNAFILDDD
ncbi:753_t:CDS:1 [Diversispora eburnea]|uniref:753_t:CDS:1 n=1 Tax=Diversispora eburnea TaxID=1213867 RepID=A0A9N8YKL2_9GLOM|nr:753_t:CDS:1 [Diversispora eburnea]